ncbi:MAG: protein translocase subunit SecF [Streptosporangiaceae bacterium]|jgi:preprotein translocase subunit SecF
MSRLGNIGGRLYRGEVSIEFVARKRRWYTISGLILIVSITALLVRGLDYSVDFKGGSVFQFTAPATSAAQISNAVDAAGGGNDAIVQKVGLGSSASWEVQTEKLTYSEQTKVQDALASTAHVSFNSISASFVGPSWGSQISEKALKALIAFLIAIVIYLSIAFEWKMASAALIALAHDIVITIGVYALTGFQVSPATVIGLLTILGYSLYDTVVVFDKVRENTAGLLGTARSTYSQAANLALNQTLVRSINTSLIALLPVAAILVVGVGLLGSGELKDLALVLFIGMLSGTYSSIFIATPALADLKEREPQYKALAKRVALRASGGRAAARAKAKAGKTVGSGTGTAGTDMLADGGGDLGGVADQDAVNGDVDLAAAGLAATQTDPPDERVPAGRPAGTAAPRSGAAPARPGPRQQPRRTSATKRRPSGKKKRR